MPSLAAMQASRFWATFRNSLPPPPDFHGKGGIGRWRRTADVALPSSAWRENAILKTGPQEYRSKFIDKRLEEDKRLGEVELIKEFPERQEEEAARKKDARGIRELIEEVKAMLSSMNDGEITSSAYDTAWVAMVPNLSGDGSGGPQFPSCLRWIIDNQLDDGSWGDEELFSAHDRIINTLASTVALRSWNICPEQCERGLLFLKQNVWRLGEENHEELMPIGFEVALPSLLDIAKGLGLDFPYNDPALQDIYSKREIKMKMIPREVMHEMPTTLLHSLEGMQGLDWEKLLRLQSLEGSFLFSPSSTAYALMETRDGNCLNYLKKVVDRFHGGVPNVYPVDVFEHLWVVDRLERLGISRFFEPEIQQLMDYVFRYWSDNGLCWARNSEVRDIDDTAMGFRLLRLHGYRVSPDVFRNFERDDGKFFGFIGQSNQAVTGMYNLNRAAQLIFSGEEILNRARAFSHSFLRDKQASNQFLDKWVIAKDLPGEVAYALDFPFYASLPRIETRWYIEQYGGGGDIWIGKTLYRMLYVNHVAYLDLAKFDFNQCQAVHQLEWLALQRWYNHSGLEGSGQVRETMLKSYFLAAASIFDPDRSPERLSWARTAVLTDAIASFYRRSVTGNFGQNFADNFHFARRNMWTGWKQIGVGLVGHILGLLGLEEVVSDRPSRMPLPSQVFRRHLRWAWMEWLTKIHGGEEQGTSWLVQGETALLLIRTVELCAGRIEPASEAARKEYDCLAELTTSICGRLQVCTWVLEGKKIKTSTDNEIDSEMQELVKCVLEPPNPGGLCRETKQTFMAIVKSFYYMAWCPSTTLNHHISKVLFEPVE